MASERRARWIFLCALLGTLIVAACVLGIEFAIQDRNERRLMKDLERTQAELFALGNQITELKDGGLKSMNDYIGAYAQIEPLQNEYDKKLQKFVELYDLARVRDSYRGVLNIENFRGRHHPETWDKMSEIVTLVRQINEITKREGQVVHGMASLPEADRVRYWHEEFTPLVAEEQALRETLLAVGQSMSPESKEQ